MALRELADSWASIYANSPAIRSALSFAHIGGLVAGGGAAIVADRAMLRALRRGPSAVATTVADLAGTHAVVIAGLVAVTLSGLLLALADLDTYLAARVFWIKMLLVVGLLANGGLLVRAGQQAARGTAGSLGLLRATAAVSLFLWFATTLLGAIVPNAL